MEAKFKIFSVTISFAVQFTDLQYRLHQGALYSEPWSNQYLASPEVLFMLQCKNLKRTPVLQRSRRNIETSCGREDSNQVWARFWPPNPDPGVSWPLNRRLTCHISTLFLFHWTRCQETVSWQSSSSCVSADSFSRLGGKKQGAGKCELFCSETTIWLACSALNSHSLWAVTLSQRRLR